MRFSVFAATLLLCSCSRGATPQYRCEVVHVYPHDPDAFTEGLFYSDGFLYEGTGDYGHSNIRKVELETGLVVKRRDLPARYFGEGIIRWKDKIIELEYQTGTGFIYNFNDKITRRSLGQKREVGGGGKYNGQAGSKAWGDAKGGRRM